MLAYSFTSRPIAEALVEAKKRGVHVDIILDRSQEKEAYSELPVIEQHGLFPHIDAHHAIAHNKVMIIDKRTLITGSFNFTHQAEVENGENLLVIRDRRVATSYMVEAIRIFDHYHFRVAQQQAKERRETLELVRPPRNAGDVAWWDKYYTDPAYVNDRKLFSRVSGDQPAPGSDPAAKAAGAP